jgi:hypothetical protein
LTFSILPRPPLLILWSIRIAMLFPESLLQNLERSLKGYATMQPERLTMRSLEGYATNRVLHSP